MCVCVVVGVVVGVVRVGFGFFVVGFCFGFLEEVYCCCFFHVLVSCWGRRLGYSAINSITAVFS